MGLNRPLTAEERKRRSETMKRRLQDPVLRQKWSDVKRGSKHTEETKQKIRASKLGAKNPQFGKVPKSSFKPGMLPWNTGLTKFNHLGLMANSISRANDVERNPFFRRGPDSPVWKGGRLARPSYRRQLELNRDWLARNEWRKAVLERDNYTCQLCGNKERLETHHIVPILIVPERIFDLSNGQTLCYECHKKFPRGNRVRRSYAVD